MEHSILGKINEAGQEQPGLVETVPLPRQEVEGDDL